VSSVSLLKANELSCSRLKLKRYMKDKLPYFFAALVVFVLDQWTKHLAEAKLDFATPIEVLPFLNWTLLYNEGAAFSFLSDAGGWQHWFLGGLALLVSIGIVIYMFRLPKQASLLLLALAMVLGGALGNLYDRVILGHVVDFIDVYVPNCSWGRCHWPAFNIADSAITVGAVLLLIDAFKNPEGRYD